MSYMSRDDVIAFIRSNLKRRSGKNWSVTGGRGTAYGWIKIDAPPAKRNWTKVESGKMQPDPHSHMPQYIDIPLPPDSKYIGHMSPDDRKELAKLLCLEDVHFQGVSIPASGKYYQEYMDRASGKAPSVYGEQYWD